MSCRSRRPWWWCPISDSDHSVLSIRSRFYTDATVIMILTSCFTLLCLQQCGVSAWAVSCLFFSLSCFLEFLSVSGRWCVTHTPLSPAQCRNVRKHTTHNVKLENERESEETPAQSTALRQRLPPITEPALGAKGSSSSQELYLFYIYV